MAVLSLLMGRPMHLLEIAGAGKSTLAAAFLNIGHQLLSDDVIAISLSQDDRLVVTPSYPQQKLWENSIVHLGMETNSYNPLYKEVNKYAVPVAATFCSDQIPLAGVSSFFLLKTKKRRFISFKAWSGSRSYSSIPTAIH